MMKRPSTRPLLAALAFSTACSSQARVEPPPSSAGPQPPMQLPSCNKEPDKVCQPEGIPFAEAALAVSDLCGGPPDSCPLGAHPPVGATTALLKQPDAGKLCLTGAVKAGGWSQIIVAFSQVNGADNQILKTFDAQGLGITQVAFTLDSPPSGGIIVDGAVVTSRSCPEGFLDCITWGFNLMGPGSSSPRRITAPGRIVAPLSQFKQTRPAPASQTFDTRALDHFAFGVAEGPYDFCVSDLQFLDVAGQVVNPSTRSLP